MAIQDIRQDIRIVKAENDGDFETLAKLAGEIWRECYAAIISSEQIEYMLGNMQSYAAIKRHAEEGYSYYAAYGGEEPIGYCAAYIEDGGGVFISKLYVKAARRGEGLAKLLLERAIADLGANAAYARLCVNKNNAIAIAAYNRMGFEKAGELVTDIGAGLVMDDYIMKKVL